MFSYSMAKINYINGGLEFLVLWKQISSRPTQMQEDLLVLEVYNLMFSLFFHPQTLQLLVVSIFSHQLQKVVFQLIVHHCILFNFLFFPLYCHKRHHKFQEEGILLKELSICELCS